MTTKIDTYAAMLAGALNDAAEHDKRIKLFTELLECFDGYDMRVVGTMHEGTLLIRRKAWPYGDVFYLCDNGGEVNVGPVNKDDDMRSVAYTRWSCMLDGATLAYRIRCVLDGDEIDYKRDASDMIPILREMAAEQEAARTLP